LKHSEITEARIANSI